MPNEPKSYSIGGEVYDIPDAEVASFLKDNPQATEVSSWTVGKDTFDIPVSDVDAFLKDNPQAKSIKKKISTEVSSNGGQPVSNNTPTTSTSDAEKLQQVPLVGQSFTQQNLQNNQQTVTPQESVTPDIPVMSEEDKVNALKGIKPQSDLSPSQIQFKQKQNLQAQKLNIGTANNAPEVSNKNVQDALVKLQENPNDDNAIYQLGYGNLESGNKEGAQSLFTQALHINPNNYKAKVGLGNIDFDNGNFQGALDYYQSAMPNIPEKVTLSDGKEYNNPDYIQNILNITQQQTLLSKDNKDLQLEASKNVDYLLSQDPDNYLANQLKAQLEKQNGNQKSADEYNNKALTDYVSQTPVKTIADVEAEWKRLHPKEERTFMQAWLDAHNEFGTTIGEYTKQMGFGANTGMAIAMLIDPLGYEFGQVEGIKEGLKNIGEGINKMKSDELVKSDNMTKQYFTGLTQTLKGGAEAAFGGLMMTPAGILFNAKLGAADALTNDWASKVILAPLETMLPHTDDELTNNVKHIGDLIIGGVVLHQAHGDNASKNIGKIKDAYTKWKEGKPLTPDETTLLQETVQENATPERLNEIQQKTESLPDDLTVPEVVEVIKLQEEYDVKEKEIEDSHKTLQGAKKEELKVIEQKINDIVYDLDSKDKTEPIELTRTKTEDVSAQPSEEVGVKVPTNPKEETATVTEDPKEEVKSEIPMVDKSTNELEKKWNELNDNLNGDNEKEFNAVEKELIKRERDSVFNVPLKEADKQLDKFLERHKNYKTEGEPFVGKSDARNAKNVIERYSNDKLISDDEVKQDFKEALMGKPETSYADGLQLRESMRVASERNIDITDLLKEVENEFVKDGYDIATAKSVIAGYLEPIFKGKESIEKPKELSPSPEQKVEAGSVGVGGDVKQQELDAQKINKEAGVDVYVARQGVETNGDKYTLSQIKENGNTNTFLIEDANGNEIGKAQLSADGNYLENIRIDEKHRRKGLASKVYDFIELRKGIELEPSPNKQSKEAKALWDNRNLKKSVSNKANGGLLAKSLGEAMSKTFADFKNKQQVLLELENKYFEQKGLSKEDFNKLNETEKAEIIKDAVKWKNDNPELVKAVEQSLKETTKAETKKVEAPIPDVPLVEKKVQETIDNANYKPRHKNGVVIKLPIDLVLDNQEQGFKVERGKNEIGSRIDKAKKFLESNPKDLEASDIYIKDSGKEKGKIGFADGRHRLIAAKELGATHAYFELPATKEQFDALNYLLTEFGNDKGIDHTELYSTQGDYRLIQTSDNTFLLNKGNDIYTVKLNESGGFEDAEINKNGKKIKGEPNLLLAVQNHLQEINPESHARNINKFLGRDKNAPIPTLDKTSKKEQKQIDKLVESDVPLEGEKNVKNSSEKDLKGNPKENWMFPFENKTINVSDISDASKIEINKARKNIDSGKDSKTNELPQVQNIDGIFYVDDGHHRIAQEIKNGKTKVNVRVGNLIPISEALDSGKFEKAIKDGKMTAEDAKTIIESAGLKVPKEISDLMEGEKNVQKTPFGKAISEKRDAQINKIQSLLDNAKLVKEKWGITDAKTLIDKFDHPSEWNKNLKTRGSGIESLDGWIKDKTTSPEAKELFKEVRDYFKNQKKSWGLRIDDFEAIKPLEKEVKFVEDNFTNIVGKLKELKLLKVDC